MSEWDNDFGSSNDFDDQGTKRQGRSAPAAGGLHIGMTVVCLLAVTAVSFGVAFLMKDLVRTFWEMGLTFAAPFAALMASALFVEYQTGKMTPACSRRAQAGFAAVVIGAAFLFGILAEVLHQPVIIERTEPEYDYIIVLDKSSSTRTNDLEKTCRDALHSMLNSMEDECRVGIVAFDDTLRGTAEIGELDADQRQKIRAVIDLPSKGATDFSEAMDAVIALADKDTDRHRTLRIILVTDGDQYTRGDFNAFKQWALEQNAKDSSKKNVELSAIQLGDPMISMVKDAVNTTGGKIYDQTDPAELARELMSLKSTLVIPEPVDTLKATFDGITADGKPNTPYVILTGVMLLLLGLLCGFSLMVMFSLHGQFRFQVILSALMGICAFLLLNYGRHLSISPAWMCEGLAFSLFGLVFMRENGMAGIGKKSGRAVQATEPDSFDQADGF